MTIYIKIGTMPGKTLHLCRKRNPPNVGERVYVKSENKPYVRAESVVIDGIKDVGGRILYFAYRL